MRISKVICDTCQSEFGESDVYRGFHVDSRTINVADVYNCCEACAERLTAAIKAAFQNEYDKIRGKK